MKCGTRKDFFFFFLTRHTCTLHNVFNDPTFKASTPDWCKQTCRNPHSSTYTEPPPPTTSLEKKTKTTFVTAGLKFLKDWLTQEDANPNKHKQTHHKRQRLTNSTLYGTSFLLLFCWRSPEIMKKILRNKKKERKKEAKGKTVRVFHWLGLRLAKVVHWIPDPRSD